jgi:hypothetical protein
MSDIPKRVGNYEAILSGSSIHEEGSRLLGIAEFSEMSG